MKCPRALTGILFARQGITTFRLEKKAKCSMATATEFQCVHITHEDGMWLPDSSQFMPQANGALVHKKIFVHSK